MAASVDEQTKIGLHQLNTMQNQLTLVKEFKKAVSTDIRGMNNSITRLATSMSKSFSLSSLGSKIGDIFNRGFKTLSNPFKGLGNKIGSAFTGLKAKFANFRPFEGLKEKLKGITKKPVEKVKTLLGRNDEQLKNKYYRLWWNPKKVAKIWAKEFNQNKNLTPATAKKSAGITEIGGAIMGVVAKFFAMAKKFIAKVLIQVVAAFHSAIGPYVLLIVGTIILLALLFKDEIKQLIPVFGKILSVVADVLDQVKGPLGNLLVKVLGAIVNVYDAIFNTLSTILNGISSLLQSAVDLIVHIVTTVDTVWNLLSDVLITLLTPIRDVVVALQPVFEGMVNLLKRFIDNPVGTAVDVGKTVVGGIKGVIGGLFGSDTKDEKEGGSILDNLFSKIADGLMEIKDFIANGGLKFILKEGFDSVVGGLTTAFNAVQGYIKSGVDYLAMKFNNLKIFDNVKAYLETTIPEFHTDLYSKLDSLALAISTLNLSSGIGGAVNNMFTAASTTFNSLKNKIKGFFGFEVTEEDKRAAEGPKNPFEEIIKGFETMRKDTVALLTDIKTSLLKIEKNKIQIGNTLAENKGEASDGKKANNLQNITFNYQVDIDKVIDKLDETNKTLNGILTNTSMDDKGKQITGAVWSI